jgi:glycosyltransferase involved in cell wall biosynthesis
MKKFHDAPLVSVLVTVYNREAYLGACLESILSSTFMDFEVVVVDDGSSDGSVMIGEAYASADLRLRFFRNEKNLGDYPNRLRAAELARGKYIKYVDSDDLIYRHSLAIMVEAMEANPEAVAGLCHSRPEDDKPYPWLLQPKDAWHKQFLGRGCMSAGPSSAILRRDALFAVGAFRDWGVLNDTDLWFRLSANHPILLLPPGLVWWRRHEGQEFTRNDASIVYIERGFCLIMDTLHRPDCPLDEEERKLAIERARQHHARRLWSMALKNRQPRAALKVARRTGMGVLELIDGLKRYS